jgi:hypothetical protein
MIITNLLANMVVLTLHSTIPTNTPAFQEYAFREMFSQSSNMIVSWNLDLPRPITTNMVTDFHADADRLGPQGLITFSNRFIFSWLYSGAPTFNDKPYNIMSALTPDVEMNDAMLEKWMRATNLLTMNKAEKIAEMAIKSVNVSMYKLDFKKPKHKWQRRYEWKDGKVYPLPYYEFRWDTYKGYCEVDVSGITHNVSHFAFLGYPYLQFQRPTNYFEMLGLPTNAVFVHPFYTPPGQPQRYELREPVK